MGAGGGDPYPGPGPDLLSGLTDKSPINSLPSRSVTLSAFKSTSS